MGAKSLFLEWIRGRVYPGVRAPCVSVFSCDLYHLRLWPLRVCRGLLELIEFSSRQNLCSSSVFFLPLCVLFPPLPCARVFVQTDLSPVHVANDSLSENGLNFHHGTFTVHFWHQTDVSYLLLSPLLVSGKTSEIASYGCWVFIFIVIKSSKCQYFKECCENKVVCS